MSGEITPFRIQTSQAELDDLRERLAQTRFPDAEPVGDWSQGIPARVHAHAVRLLAQRLRLARNRGAF